MPAIIAGAVVLALAAVLAVSITGGGDGDGAGNGGGLQQVAAVDVAGDGLPQAPAGGADPAVGQPAPALQGENFAGEPVAITHDGTPKVLLFLAHWCPHCQRELPEVSDWLADGTLPTEGVEWWAVVTGTRDDAPNYPPSAWLEREGWPGRVLLDDAEGDAAQAYGLSGYPFFVVVDGDGDVVARASGDLSQEQIRNLLSRADIAA